ncbi:MAG: 4Fe-4S ferredoxin, partial [Clostridia bacterium]|nr:4Fe-4S ferredoxin [Clostridia bacterium]
MKKLQKKDLPRFLAELKKQATVYVPVDNDGLTQFAVWEEGTEPALDKNTIISPKKIFFPQTEELYAYETKKLQAAVQELDGVGGPT